MRDAITQTVYASELVDDVLQQTDKARMARMTQGARAGYIEDDDLNPEGLTTRAIEQLYGQDEATVPLSRLAPLPSAVLTARN